MAKSVCISANISTESGVNTINTVNPTKRTAMPISVFVRYDSLSHESTQNFMHLIVSLAVLLDETQKTLNE